MIDESGNEIDDETPDANAAEPDIVAAEPDVEAGAAEEVESPEGDAEVETPEPVVETPAADPEMDALRAEVAALAETTSEADARQTLQSQGVSAEEARRIVEDAMAQADQRRASAAAPQEDPIAARLDALPDDLRPLGEMFVESRNEVARLRAELREQRETEQRGRAQSDVDAALADEIKASPVHKLLSKRGAGVEFEETVRDGFGKLWTEKVNDTHRALALRGHVMTRDEAAKFTPPPTRAEIKALVGRKGKPYAVLIAESAPKAAKPKQPAPMGRTSSPAAATASTTRERTLRGSPVAAAAREGRYDPEAARARVAATLRKLTKTQPDELH